MTRDETHFSGQPTWDGLHFQAHHVFALFLKTFKKKHNNCYLIPKGGIGWALLPTVVTENAQGLVSHCTFFSMNSRGPTVQPLLPAVVVWPGLCLQAAQQGLRMQLLKPLLSPGHLQPHRHSMSVFHAYFSCLFSWLLLSSSWSWCRRAWKWKEDGLKFKQFKWKRKMGTYRVLSGFQKHLKSCGAS